MGRSHKAFFRLNAIDSRSPRDGSVIEELGFHDPLVRDPSKEFVANLDRCKYWLDHGAIPSARVSSLLKKAGVEHKQLRLPKPGKPKVAPAPPAEKKPAAAAPVQAEAAPAQAEAAPAQAEPKKEETTA